MHTKPLASLALMYTLNLFFVHIDKKSNEKFFEPELSQIVKNVHHLNGIPKLKYSKKSLTNAKNGKHSVAHERHCGWKLRKDEQI